MYATATDQLVSGFVRILQLAFMSNTEYPWSPNITETRIHVMGEFPTREVKYPSIVINTAPGGEAMLRTIGGEFREDVTSDVSIDGITRSQITAQKFGGGFHIGLDISVAAETTTQRNRIADLVVMYLRWGLLDKIRAEGIDIQNITLGGVRHIMAGTYLVQYRNIRVSTYSEWEDIIPVGVRGTIDSLCIQNVFTTLPEGASTGSFLP